LTVEEIFKFLSQYHVVNDYLPEERDIPKLPRQWIVNLGYSVIGNEFEEWVNLLVKERNKRLIEEKNLTIKLDPEIAKAFHAATAVSSQSNFSWKSDVSILNFAFASSE
jgi:hypothetical protein